MDDLTVQIRRHYDRLSLFYRLLWGRHIHHGLFDDAPRSPAEAQVALIGELVAYAGLPRGAEVLDIGCGYGGSSLYLAQHRACNCVGITISPVQARAAARAARREGLEARCAFRVLDANDLSSLGAARFDAAWCVECSEHIRDKPRLIRQWFDLLRPGGRVALAAWCETDDLTPWHRARFIEPITRGMLLPGLASVSAYRGWMEEAGFVSIRSRDITRGVARTWSLCRAAVRRPWIAALLPFSGRRTRAFVASFEAMESAFASGALRYSLLAGMKPV